MNCELAHEKIVLAAYGELPDEQIHELERHLTLCAECREEREQLQALRTLAAVLPVAEPPANLVARSRLRLEEALDALPPKRWYERLSQRLMNNLASLQAAPVAALLLLVAGAGAGSLGGYEYAQSRAAQAAAVEQVSSAPSQPAKPQAQPATVPTAAEVASISSIIRQPNSNLVEVSYEQVVPQRVRGSLDDPAIRQLLMMASEDAASAGVRDDSVGLLASECRTGHSCQAAGIRDAPREDRDHRRHRL